jgi:hypothetical protein
VDGLEKIETGSQAASVTVMFLLAVIVDKLKTLPDEFDRDPTEVLVKIIVTRRVSF